MQRLAASNAHLDARDKYDMNALIVAAYDGHTACVQSLLVARARVDSKTRFGRTALMWAAYRGYDACVQQLVDAQADLEVVDAESKNALPYAAEKGNPAGVHLLIAGKADLEVKGEHKGSALIVAAYEGHSVRVRFLRTAKATIAAKDDKCSTALIWAASESTAGAGVVRCAVRRCLQSAWIMGTDGESEGCNGVSQMNGASREDLASRKMEKMLDFSVREGFSSGTSPSASSTRSIEAHCSHQMRWRQRSRVADSFRVFVSTIMSCLAMSITHWTILRI